MSIASLANDEILRTERGNLDLARITDAPLAPLIDSLPNVTPQQLRAAVRPAAAAEPIEKTPGSNALDSLANYIPTESVTLYVAATAALPILQGGFPFLTQYRLYWGFVVLTPILFLLIYIGKRRSQKLRPLPRAVARWPWWKSIASTIAFMAWALAIPPLATTAAGRIVAAFGALFVSIMLNLVGAAVEPAEA